MGIKEQVLAIGERLRTIPSKHLVAVLLVLVKPALAFWAAEVNKHHEVMLRYPTGTAMRKSVEAKYDEAFGHWHRVSFLIMRIEEAMAFKGLGSTGHRPRLGKPVEPVQEAA